MYLTKCVDHQSALGRGSRMRKTLLLLFLAIFFHGDLAKSQDPVVRVGVFNNAPIVFIDDKNQARGLAIELLSDIARQEGWTLEFVPAPWKLLLEKLDKAEIDILVGIAYSPARAERFVFSEQTLINNWGLVYRAHNSDISSLIDLKGKRVAVMSRSIHSRVFADVMRKFAFDHVTVPAKSYDGVLKLVEDGKADAGVINRVFSILKAPNYQAMPTPIMFNPVEVRYASPMARGDDLVGAIDRHLAQVQGRTGVAGGQDVRSDQQKQNTQSVYHRSLRHWFGAGDAPHVHEWVLWSLALIISLLLLVLGFNLLLRRKVRVRSAELVDKSLELADKNERLQLVMDSTAEAIFGVDREGVCMFANPACVRMLGYSSEQDLLGKNMHTLMHHSYADGSPYPVENCAVRLATQRGESLHSDKEVHWRADGSSFPAEFWAHPIKKGGELVGTVVAFVDITERKQAEAAARDSEARFSAIIDSTYQFIGLMLPDGTLIEANQTALNAADLKREDVIGKPFWEAYWWTLSSKIQHQLERAVAQAAQGEFVRYDTEIRGVADEVISVDFSIKPIFNEQGEVIYLLPEGRDITKANQARQALSQERDFSTAVLDTVGSVVVVLDGAGKIVRFNRACENLTGYRFAEVEGRHVWDMLLRPEDIEPVKEVFVTLTAGQFPNQYQNHWVTKAGEERMIAWSNSALTDDNGSVSYIIATGIDVTEQQRAMVALRESEEKFRMLVENAPYCIHSIDREGRLAMMNPAGLQMMNAASESEVVGMPYLDAVTETERAQVAEFMERAWAGQAQDFEFEAVNGKIFRSSFVPVYRKKREGAQSLMGVTQDITEKQQAEKELSYRLEFEQLIARLSTRFINIDAQRIDTNFNEALAELGDFVGADRSFLLQFDEIKQTVNCTHEWCSSNTSSLMEYITDIPMQTIPWLMQNLQQGKVVQVPDVQALPAAASAEKQRFVSLSIQSLITVPLLVGDNLLGMVEFDAVHRQKKWSDDVITLLHIVGQVFVNVLERHRAQVQEQRLRAVFEASPDFVAMADSEGRALYVNPAGRAMVDLEADVDISTTSIPDYHPAPEAERLITQALPVARDKGLWRGESVFLNRRGEEIPTLQIFLAHNNADGEVAYYSTIARDISDLKQAEATLRLYAERLKVLRAIDQAILQSDSPIEIAKVSFRHIKELIPCQRCSVMLFDFDTATGQILVAEGIGNEQAHNGKVLSLATEFAADIDLLKQGKTDKIDDLAQKQEMMPIEQKLFEAGIRSILYVPLWVSDKLIGCLNLASTQVAIFTREHEDIARQITDSLAIAIQQAQLHEKIASHARELEQRVTERTAALSMANKEMESFNYSVSHDLRTPLRAMDGYSQLLTQDYATQLDEDGRHYLARIRNAAQNMGQIIDDLLLLSRISRSSMKRSDNDLLKICQQIVAGLRERHPERTEVDLIVPAELRVSADPGLLGIMMTNLLANAWKFTAKQSHARIEIGRGEHDGRSCLFVCDNGVGFDMSYRDKLFLPFQRLHEQVEFEGTGVGLATVARIVQRHNGWVAAKATLGEGACFYFDLGAYEN